MSDLSEYAKKQNVYLRVMPGEEITVVYQSAKIVPNKFDPEKEQVQYQFLYEGQKKFWETSSGKAAAFFDGCTEGDIVSIKNIGKEKAPRYEFNKIIDAAPKNTMAKEIAESVIAPPVPQQDAKAVVIG